MGALCTELAKLGHPAGKKASRLFGLFRSWLSRQFSLMGCSEDPDILAMHVLAFSQGVAVLANAYHDKRFVAREVSVLCAWVDGLTLACPLVGQ